jgi:hypothetical protein
LTTALRAARLRYGCLGAGRARVAVVNKFLAIRFSALALFVLLTACAGVGPGLTGNDTDGIISYSPENRAHAREMASEHCAHYGKRAHLTAVHARYGGYIRFSCRFDRRFSR